MNWFVVAINFVILLGISIYYRTNKELKFSGRLGDLAMSLSGFAVLFSSEYLVLLYWLGNAEAILALELSMLITIPLALYMSKKQKSAGSLLSHNLLQKDNMVISSIYLVGYLIIKLTLVLISSVFILNKLLGWSSVSALVAVIMMVATYTVFGNFKSLIMSHVFQALIIFVGIFLFITNKSSNLMLQNDIQSLYQISIPVWKIATVGLLYGIWCWTFEQQLFQRVNYNSNTNILPVIAIIKILAIFVLVGFSGYTIPQNALINLGILSVVMASLANIFNGIATLVVEDFYRKIKPVENPWEGDLISKIIITGLAFFSVLMVLIMKNTTMEQVLTLWGFWMNFTIISVVLVLFSKIKPINISTIVTSYLLGVAINTLPLLFDNQIINKLFILNIFDKSLLIIGIVSIVVLVNYLFSMITLNQVKLQKEKM